jgi:succinyl-diaminopimelate desuccinylase
MTSSPDAEFPLINIEKGQFRGIISKKYEESTALPRILSLDAGVAFNAVPQKAVIKFEGLDMDAAKGAMEEIAKACEVEVNVTADQEITIIGESAHASTPENGKNAGLAAMMLASKLDLADSECLEFVKKIPELFPYGVTDGSGIGIKMCDEESHDLTCTLDLYHVDPTGMEFTFDSRVPVMGTKENCQDVAEKNITAAGFDFTTPGMVPPHRVAGDSDFVQTLLGSYEKVTVFKGECLAIGGGTYVHELKNGVAFGAILPDIDTRMHGADEFMDIDNIMIATKVFADAIWELCGDK